MTTADRGGSTDGPAPRLHAGAVLASGVVEALGGSPTPDDEAVLRDFAAFTRLLRNAGVPVTPDGLTDVSCYPVLLDALRDRSWSAADLAALAYGNISRVLHDAEAVAVGLREGRR